MSLGRLEQLQGPTRIILFYPKDVPLTIAAAPADACQQQQQ